VLRRSLTILAVAAAAIAAAAPALAVDVHVRVEGVTRTIFGAAEPTLPVFTGPLAAADGSQHDLSQPTALGALESASIAGEFFYDLQALSFGLFVDRIGRYPGSGDSGWAYKVNGASPPVGAADYALKDGDRVLWYWATFGATGGPATLDVKPGGREGSRTCFRTVAQDDAGNATAATDVVFLLDGRRVRSSDGRICPAGNWHRLRATKAGAVRSAVLAR
jgi:Domain of unknown function (DUF4430)